MERFFHSGRLWGEGPYPHFLILLNEHPAYRAYAEAHHGLLSGYPLGVVPAQWLHSTILGIHQRVSPDQMELLRCAARTELSAVAPCEVQLGPVWPGVTAITAAMYPEDGLAVLNARARAAAESVPGITLRPPEPRFWGHSTLAYALAGYYTWDVVEEFRLGSAGTSSGYTTAA
ncbi:hypothetical protein [Streptomyces sp. AC550_RSS872]|uniref:hypothetical protein n=1 Tax=Streptomyces sp. AC550_RSS872 TaxID=2823689 RepID=UPI001C26D2A8|nr:hypothetical protein [Streptomyces sp. AC550_RSS872]